LHGKSIFHFLIAEKCFFREAATKYLLQIWTKPFFMNRKAHFIDKSPGVSVAEASGRPSRKIQNPVDSAGSGLNLNYSSIIACS
jgi:hypothetical protein